MDFNGQYSQNEYVPERLIGDADAGLSSFFQFCYDAGPLKCAFWYSSVTEIRDHFFEVDRKLLEKPLPIPGFGLFKIPTWRFGVFDALYRPALTFPVLAGVAAEIINGTAGSAIQTYLETLANATSSAEPPLVDPITGLKNSPNPLFTIGCGDRGPSVEELGPTELEAIFNKHLEASQFFGGVSATTEIICLGKWEVFSAPKLTLLTISL